MKYDDFNELVRSRLAEICGPEFSISIFESLKNNSVVHKGISIKEDDNNVSPTIYMDEFYTDYCDGRDLEDILNEMLRIYSENRLGPDFDTGKFSDFEWVRDRIFFKLVNARENATLLEQVPHERFLDLAVVYGVYMGSFRDSFSSVMIKNEHLLLWNVAESDIRERALVNTPTMLPSAICTMKDMLYEMGVEVDDIMDNYPMYVLTNRERVNGASTMLYNGIVGKFASNLGSDLYILPSSIHEMIIVPANDDIEPSNLLEMIAEVNDTQVAREEILSYSLYKYSRDSGVIDMVCAPRTKKVASA